MHILYFPSKIGIRKAFCLPSNFSSLTPQALQKHVFNCSQWPKFPFPNQVYISILGKAENKLLFEGLLQILSSGSTNTALQFCLLTYIFFFIILFLGNIYQTDPSPFIVAEDPLKIFCVSTSTTFAWRTIWRC